MIFGGVAKVSGDAEHQPYAMTLAHALLDVVPSIVVLQTPVSEKALEEGAALFWQLLHPGHARLAMKLAQARGQILLTVCLLEFSCLHVYSLCSCTM